MKEYRQRNNIAYIFLALFIAIKVSGLHVFFHIDDKDHIENCELCDYNLIHSLTPSITNDSQSIITERIEIILKENIIKDYCFFCNKAIVITQLFSRPPPFL